MSIGQLGAVGRLGLTPTKGVAAAAYAPRIAPAGYAWDFVTEAGVRVTDRRSPVVALVRIT